MISSWWIYYLDIKLTVFIVLYFPMYKAERRKDFMSVHWDSSCWLKVKIDFFLCCFCIFCCACMSVSLIGYINMPFRNLLQICSIDNMNKHCHIDTVALTVEELKLISIKVKSVPWSLFPFIFMNFTSFLWDYICFSRLDDYICVIFDDNIKLYCLCCLNLFS